MKDTKISDLMKSVLAWRSGVWCRHLAGISSMPWLQASSLIEDWQHEVALMTHCASSLIFSQLGDFLIRKNFGFNNFFANFSTANTLVRHRWCTVHHRCHTVRHRCNLMMAVLYQTWRTPAVKVCQYGVRDIKDLLEWLRVTLERPNIESANRRPFVHVQSDDKSQWNGYCRCRITDYEVPRSLVQISVDSHVNLRLNTHTWRNKPSIFKHLLLSKTYFQALFRCIASLVKFDLGELVIHCRQGSLVFGMNFRYVQVSHNRFTRVLIFLESVESQEKR